MRLLILCLLTCVAYLVIFKIETMWTSVSHCEDCVVISWLILVLILRMSLVVAVPVNRLRTIPRKGSKLLLHLVLDCGWFKFSRYMVDVMEISWDWYMSYILDSSNCRVVSSCGDANGCCSKELRNCFVLANCHLKSFQ